MSVATELTRIQTAKADIKASIEAKGVTVPSDALIDQYADYVDEIQTGGGGGQAEEVLKNLIERDITSINIPNGTTSIGLYTFYGCSSLTNITIPNSVTSIGQSAFQNCSHLTDVTIGSGVTSIGNQAFDSCNSLPVENYIRYADTCAVKATNTNQTSYTLKEGTRFIHSDCFNNCRNITDFTIPNTVLEIGNNAFYSCSGITSLTIPSNVLSIPSKIFDDQIERSITINSNGVMSQNRSASAYSSFNSFFGKLINCVIGDGVTTIGNNVFYGCSSLTNITIPNSVTSIGEGAFYNCIGLTSVTIPNSVTSIGNQAFYNCRGLTSVTIGNGVTSIGNQAFYNCTSLTSVTINATTPPTLGTNVFQGTNANLVIYVPAESVEAYKTTGNWVTYADRIFAIPSE